MLFERRMWPNHHLLWYRILVLSFNIYLIRDWILLFLLFVLYWIFHLFWKWFGLPRLLILDCLIIKLQSFIQFAFDGVTSISQPYHRFYMLTQIDMVRFFNLFWILFFNILFVASFFIFFIYFLWGYHVLI